MIILYLIKSTVSLILLLAFYHLVLKPSKTLKANRFFLLSALVFSLLMPVLKFNSPFNIGIEETELIKVIEGKTVTHDEPQVSKPDNFQTVSTENGIRKMNGAKWFSTLYFAGFLFMIFRFIRNLVIMSNFSHSSSKIRYRNAKIILIQGKSNPFSFLRNIYVNKSKYQKGEIDNDILEHEYTHVKGLHSLDIILIELITIFYWFNPILYFYKKAISENNEFLADEEVLKDRGDKEIYSHKIINHTIIKPQPILASGCNHSQIKKRLIMITKDKKSKKRIFFNAFAMVILFAGISCFAVDDMEQKFSPQNDGITFYNKSSHHEMKLNDSVFIANYFKTDVMGVHIEAPLIRFNKNNATFIAGPFKGKIDQNRLRLWLTEELDLDENQLSIGFIQDAITNEQDGTKTLFGQPAVITYSEFKFSADLIVIDP